MGGPAERRPLAQASEPAPEPEEVVQQGLEVDEEGEESDEYDVEVGVCLALDTLDRAILIPLVFLGRRSGPPCRRG